MSTNNFRDNEAALVFELLTRAKRSGGSLLPITGEDISNPAVEREEIERFLGAVMRLAREHIAEKRSARTKTEASDVREFGYL